jgi:hypothetical protein
VIEADGSSVDVTRGKDRGNLLDPLDSYDTGCRDGTGNPCSFWLKIVTLADDGSISVRAAYGDEATQVVSFTPAQLDARIEATRAWKLAKATQWADAEAAAARSLALEPGSLPVTLALARARVHQGKPAAAGLQPLVAAHAVELYADLVADPLLAPLVDAPELAGMRASSAGTARVSRQQDFGIAYSPERDALAMLHSAHSGEGMEHYAELELRDPHTGALLVSQPINDKAGIQLANQLLADLGFSVPTDLEDAAEPKADPDRDGLWKASLPIAHLGVVADDKYIRVLRKNQSLGQCPADISKLDWVTYSPGAHVVVSHWTRYKRMAFDPEGVCIVRVP